MKLTHRYSPSLLVLAAGLAVMDPTGASLLRAEGAPTRLLPAAPSTAQAQAETAGVTLTWTDNAVNETGYRVVRETLGPTSWVQTRGVTLDANVTSFVDNPAVGRHRYRVRAFNARGNSSWSNFAEVTIASPVTADPAPAAPSGLSLSSPGPGMVSMTWVDRSSNETRFEIERNPAFSAPVSVDANVTSFAEAVLAGTYAYRVRAVNAAGASAYTAWDSVAVASGSGQNLMTGGGGESRGAPASLGTFDRLVPGSGFTGPTPTAPRVGSVSSPGYDARAIARWDVVPNQTFTGTMNVGVVAFHYAGIQRVDFSVNGGPWTSVFNMQLNPQTGVYEYTAAVNASDFADGRIEVRAIAYPRVGEPKMLQDASGTEYGDKSLYLYTNANGTLPNTGVAYWVSPSGDDAMNNGSASAPFRTIARAISATVNRSGTAEGGTINLLPGVYTYPDTGNINGTDNRWLTVQAAPGVPATDVVFTSPGVAVSQRMLRLKDVRLVQGTDSAVLRIRSDPYRNHFWLDNCQVFGLGYLGTGKSSEWVIGGGAYTGFMTNVTVSNTASTIINDYYQLARNVRGTELGGDFVRSGNLIVNCSVNHMRFDGSVHPDVVQWPIGELDNMIIFGLKATDVAAQGLTIGDPNMPMSNVAVVNALLHKIPSDPQRCWIQGGSTTNHLLFWHVTLVNYEWHVNRDGHRNMSIRNSIIPFMTSTSGRSFPGLIADSNHFINPTNAFGTNYTTGSPMWMNESALDFRPGTGSPLRQRLTIVPVPADLENRPIVVGQESQSQAASIGALQP